MSQELKPCPFCGGTPNPPAKTGGGDERNGYNFTIKIACVCGCTVEARSKEGPGGWCKDKGEAMQQVIDTWNSRAAQQGETP